MHGAAAGAGAARLAARRPAPTCPRDCGVQGDLAHGQPGGGVGAIDVADKRRGIVSHACKRSAAGSGRLAWARRRPLPSHGATPACRAAQDVKPGRLRLPTGKVSGGPAQRHGGPKLEGEGGASVVAGAIHCTGPRGGAALTGGRDALVLLPAVPAASGAGCQRCLLRTAPPMLPAGQKACHGAQSPNSLNWSWAEGGMKTEE